MKINYLFLEIQNPYFRKKQNKCLRSLKKATLQTSQLIVSSSRNYTLYFLVYLFYFFYWDIGQQFKPCTATWKRETTQNKLFNYFLFRLELLVELVLARVLWLLHYFDSLKPLREASQSMAWKYRTSRCIHCDRDWSSYHRYSCYRINVSIIDFYCTQVNCMWHLIQYAP